MTGWAVTMLVSAVAVSGTGALRLPDDEALIDFSSWRKYRRAVTHPAATIKPEDLERARENLRRYDWARERLAGLDREAWGWLDQVTPGWLERMIPADTPGDTLFTPCPACRDLGKPMHPAGQWRWRADDPDRLTCEVCGTVFPNARYPENMVFESRYVPGQKITFFGGEPFDLFGFRTRPTFAGNIRARKVDAVASACLSLAEAYALTGKSEYARAVRRILLRFARVYPKWLVHVGYGEYADMDPHLAALNISALPQDEITAAPSGPDRKLHSGYWQGGRATGTGMEGGFVRRVTEAYTLVRNARHRGRPLFTDRERLVIERDLLLESTVLLIADKSLNNKSVGNATAAALVGMVVGHPGLVRFGLDAFNKTVDGWFLPDGGTSESYSYAMMTLGGIFALGQASRGYSDPPGYRDDERRRLDDLNLYRSPAYQRVWNAMFNGLQGDLHYPPLADGYRSTEIGARFAEAMADNYPENGQYLALLKEYAGPDLSGGGSPERLYCRPPGLEKKPTPALTLPDHLFPALQIGYLRGGATGRESCLVLSASDWGGHHHLDSLSLYYWESGKELLSDLGYLWDHPMKSMTYRTFAHNTVMVDGRDQIAAGRGGRFTLFEGTGSIRVMEAESRAYPAATLYRRTVVQIEHDPGRRYVLDLFRVQGGRSHQYVFHGPTNAYRIEGAEPEAAAQAATFFAGDLVNVRMSSAVVPWRVVWELGDGVCLSALWHNAAGEHSLIGNGWGQRDYRNTDLGAVLPYVVRERPAAASPTVFVTIFERHAAGQPRVKGLRLLAVPPGDQGNVVAVAVETPDGADYVVSCVEPARVRLHTPDGALVVQGRFAAASVRSGRAVAARLVEGTHLEIGRRVLAGGRGGS